MRRVRINVGKVGLVFRNGDYNRLLTEGVYWIFPFESVMQYDRSQPFYPVNDLNILLADEQLANELIVVEFKDNEIALRYEDGNFRQVIGPGRHAYWKGLKDYQFKTVDLSKPEITEDIDVETLMRNEVLRYVRVFQVFPYEKGVLFINGKYDKVLENGTYYFWNNSTPVSINKADMRQLQLEVAGQEILTRDKAALRINFNAQYRVTNIEKALIENKDYEKQLYTLMQLALREFVGTYTLDELLEKKEAIAEYVMNTLDSKAKSLGVKINDCGVRDIILPGEVKDIMNQVLIAQKQAQANVITRREETASTRSLLNTAKLMEDNEMLFKLKEMEYVEKIADKIGEITVAGNGQVIDQLKGIFGTR